MGRVKFERVRLTGFGPYRETTEFIFAEGLNVFVAPNETGKSTLVAGVTALLFGLPQTTDPTVFGQARYRNWDHPLGFEGELLWQVDGESYRLRRNFQNNQISLAQLRDGEYREIIGGTHNPRAQRRNQRYEEKLKELFGLNSQDLFEATFCLTQPLPEADELDGRVQELLSGTGVGFKYATDHLAKELREITRFTGRRGVTAKDAFDPRRLEQLAAEIETTRAAIERDRALVDQLEGVRKRLGEKENDRVKLAENLAAQERMLTLWGQWQQLKQNYEAARKVYTQVQKSREQARELEATLRRIDEEKAAFPWGPTVPADSAEILSELEIIAQQKTRLQQGIAELEAERRAVELTEGEAFGAASGIDWSAFGPQLAAVVERRRMQAAEALAFWAEWEQLDTAAAENRQLQDEEYSLFQGADPDLLETLKAYEPRWGFLRSALENANLKWENTKGKLRRLERRRHRRLVLALISMVLGGGLAVLWAGKHTGIPLALLGGGLVGAACGYLAGRLFFPTEPWALIQQEMVENEAQVKTAFQNLKEFETLVKPFTERYPDVVAAVRRWERLSAEGEELVRREQELRRRELGLYSGPVAQCPLVDGAGLLNERWSELFAFAQVVDPTADLTYLGELVAWLAEKPSRWWQQLLMEAAAFEEQRAEWSRRQVRQEANQQYLAKQQQQLAALLTREEELRARIDLLLTAADGDYQEAKRLWLSWRELEQKAEKAKDALANILAIQRVKALADLEAKSDDAFLEAQTLLSERQKLVAAHPGLTQLETAADPEAIEAGYGRRREEVARAQADLRALDDEIRHLTTELARLEGQEPVNIARAEEQLAELTARYAETELVCDALTLAHQELTMAINDFQRTYRRRLAAVTSKYYHGITGISGRQVELDEDFRVTVVIDGRSVTPGQLSHGARDQLYIALRLGIADLLATEAVLPFVFDDPFLNCDAERLSNIRASLQLLAAERQVLLLSHRADFAAWGEELAVRKLS